MAILLISGIAACSPKPVIVPDISACAQIKDRPKMVVTDDQAVIMSLIDLVVYSESIESRLTCINKALGGKQ